MWWDFVLLYKSTSRHTLILCSCALFSFAAMCRTHCPFLWWVPQVKSYLISSFKHKFIIILIRKSKTTSIIPIYPRFLFITKSSASGFWIRYLNDSGAVFIVAMTSRIAPCTDSLRTRPVDTSRTCRREDWTMCLMIVITVLPANECGRSTKRVRSCARRFDAASWLGIMESDDRGFLRSSGMQWPHQARRKFDMTHRRNASTRRPCSRAARLRSDHK